MKRFLFGECVQGFSHIRNNVECQDSYKKLVLEDGTIVLAVADGHGSKSCPFSKTGSEIAVNVFCDAISKTYRVYQNDMGILPTYLNREGSLKFAKTVEQEWKASVLDAHLAMKREMPLTEDDQEDTAAVYRMYGTTLLGLLITPSFVFAFQIGDGDITYVDDSGAEPVVLGEKLLGVESHSLCSADAWKKAVSSVHQRKWDQVLPSAFLLSTDGFSNSFVSDQEFRKTCTEYFGMLKEYGAAAVEANLRSWLDETSQFGCGDDTTVLIAYFTDDTDGSTAETAEEFDNPAPTEDTAETSENQDADEMEPPVSSEDENISNETEIAAVSEQAADETAD